MPLADRIVSRLLLPMLATVLLFAVLWARDYPKPDYDDLYYTGAGLHMAAGGDFSNPLLERQQSGSHYYYVYPPLHSYTLADWLKVFGISSRSIRGFQILLEILSAVSAITILWRHDAPAFLIWLVPLAAVTSLFPFGLRAEGLSLGLTMAGLAMVECGVTNILLVFVAFWLMFLGGSAAPRLAFFVFALVVYSLLRAMGNAEKAERKKMTVLVMAGVALLVAILIFLVQIQFNLGEFWRTFHNHAKLVQARKFALFLNFFNDHHYLDGSQSPLVWTLLALLIFAKRSGDGNSMRLAWAILAGFVLEAFAGGLEAGTLWYLAFALLLVSWSVIKAMPELTLKLGAVLVFLFLLANAQFVVYEWQRLRGNITVERGDQMQAAMDMVSTPEHPVLIDGSTARYVYDYRIPKDFLDFEFAAKFPLTSAVADVHPDDIYVVGPNSARMLREATLCAESVKMLNLFMLYNRSVYCEPRRAYVIPADKCKPRAD